MNKTDRYKEHGFALCLVLVLVGGCSTSPVSHTKSSAWTLRSDIPVGTIASQAQTVLESQGYSCEVIRSGFFTAESLDATGDAVEQKLTNINFIKGRRTDRDGLVTTHISVALILNDRDEVESIEHRREFVGF